MAITKVSRGLLNTGISDSSNATAITITSDENVLIGTTSGSDPLVVSDSGASSVTARLVNTNADANPANLRLQKLSGSPADGDYIGMINVSGENDASEETIFQSIDFISTDVSDGTEDGVVAFRTRGSGTLAERMRIDSSGNIGIGTTAPTQKLAVNGGLVSIGAILSPGSAGNYTFNATALDYVSNGARSWSWGTSSARGTFNWYQLQNDGLSQINSMQLDTSGNLKFDSGFGSAGTAYGVRAWVRFKGNTSGTGNRQVNGSGNVSTVGYIAAGRYRMNFSNSMPDVYYAVSATAIGVTNHNPQSASIDIFYSNNVAYVDLAYGPSGGANSQSLSNDSGAEYNAIIVR